jgi:thioredoxin-related protein
MKKYFHFILLIISIYSCGNKSNLTETNEFKKYLNENHSVSIVDEGLYFIIPMNICSYCTKSTIKKLLSLENTKKIKIILTDFTKINFEEPSKKLNAYSILKDSRMHISKETSFFSGEYPLILQIKNNSIVKIMKIDVNENDDEIDDFLDDFFR